MAAFSFQHDLWSAFDPEGRCMSYCPSRSVAHSNGATTCFRHHHGEGGCPAQRPGAEQPEPALPPPAAQLRSDPRKVGNLEGR